MVRPMMMVMMMPRTIKMLFGLAFCLAALARLPLSNCEESQPTIVSISKEQIREIGQEAEFSCTVANLQGNTVLWQKLDKNRSDKVTLTHGPDLILKDNKFNITYHSANSTYVLKIKNLRESDTGFYECQIPITLENKISRETSLQIRRSPTISLNVTRQVNVTEGEALSLYCTADGFPTPRISWKREDDTLLSFGGVIHRDNFLRIENTQRDDRGIYICIAENDVGRQDQVNAKVYIRFKPVTSALRPRVAQYKGYRASLKCTVEAYPAPMVYWYKNATEIGRNDFAGKESPGDEYVASHSITSVAEKDYGDYSCKAVNAYGSSEARLQLIESVVPITCSVSC